MVFVKVAKGRRLRDPKTLKVLPVDGDDQPAVEINEADPHWYRLLACGDLVKVPAPAKTIPASAQASAESGGAAAVKGA
jgi:hypothetical protein